jgi:hypothetical protein
VEVTDDENSAANTLTNRKELEEEKRVKQTIGVLQSQIEELRCVFVIVRGKFSREISFFFCFFLYCLFVGLIVCLFVSLFICLFACCLSFGFSILRYSRFRYVVSVIGEELINQKEAKEHMLRRMRSQQVNLL